MWCGQSAQSATRSRVWGGGRDLQDQSCAQEIWLCVYFVCCKHLSASATNASGRGLCARFSGCRAHVNAAEVLWLARRSARRRPTATSLGESFWHLARVHASVGVCLEETCRLGHSSCSSLTAAHTGATKAPLHSPAGLSSNCAHNSVFSCGGNIASHGAFLKADCVGETAIRRWLSGGRGCKDPGRVDAVEILSLKVGKSFPGAVSEPRGIKESEVDLLTSELGS